MAVNSKVKSGIPVRLSATIRRTATAALLSLAIAALSFSSALTMAAEPDPHLAASIDKAVERIGINDSEPGVAVLIYQPDKLEFLKGYGLADLSTRKPITPQTRFELASISKTMTATAVLLLHDRGKLDIDDDIRKFLPELPVYSADHPIRIRDLLHHISGLPDYLSFRNVRRTHRDYWENADYLPVFASRQKQRPLTFPTGAKYEYNNTNFMLLASIIERVDGRSFGTFLRSEIFQPLEMAHTFVYENPQSIPDQEGDEINAIGYQRDAKTSTWVPGWGTPPARHEKLLSVGDGGIWTNLEDMARWDRAVRDRKLLKPETWNQALLPSKTRDDKTNSYGLGWSVYYEGRKGELYGFGHDGSWGGFRTTYYQYLAEDRTTVLLSNRGTLDTNQLWTDLNTAVEGHFRKGK